MIPHRNIRIGCMFLIFLLGMNNSPANAQCNTISAIQLLDHSSGRLVFQWEEVPGATGYEIASRSKGSTSVFTKTTSVTNLATLSVGECIAMEIKVRPLCNPEFSPLHIFTTDCQPCSPIVQQSILFTRPNTISLAVDFNFFFSTAHGIKFEYRNVGEEQFESIVLRSNELSLRDTFEISGFTENSAYEARISHICFHSNVFNEVIVSSNPAPVFSFTTPPISCPAPAGLTVSPGQVSATVSWIGNPTASQYNIDFREAGTSGFSRVTTTFEQTEITALKAGTTYEIKVQAICAGEPSAFSPLAIFTTTPAVCSKPVNLAAVSITETTAVLQWAAVAPANSYTIEYREPGKDFITSSSTVNSLTVTGLSPGTAYEFRVRPECPGAIGPFSELAGFSTLVECSPPTGIAITDITHNSARVNWTVSAGALSYDCRFRRSGDPVFTTIASAINTISLSGLLPSTAYEVQLQSACQGNRSNFSSSFTFTTNAAPPCTAPTGITISNLLPVSAVVSWNARQEALFYVIRFRRSGTETFTTENTFVTNKLLGQLTPLTLYEVQVQTVCDGQRSEFSNLLSFTTPELCDTVSGIQLTSRTHNSASMEWPGITGALGYNVQFRPEGAAISSAINTTINNISLTSLLPSTNYLARIQTQCSGTSSVFTSDFRFSTLPAPPCNIPVGLVADVVTTNSATINWQAATGAVRYKITSNIRGSGSFSTSFSVTPSLTLTGLQQGTNYEVQVQSICDAAESGNSNTISFTTLVPCSAPGNVQSRFITRNSADIFWNPAAEAISYNVLFNVQGTGITESRTVSATAVTLTGLRANTTYEVRVQSTCVSGNETSPPITFTTSPALPCPPPSGLSTGSISSNSAELNWQAVPGSTSYLVRISLTGSGATPETRSTSTTTLLIANLQPSVEYSFEVKTICGPDTSGFSAPVRFNTPGTCHIPGNLTTRSITSNSAFISWDLVPAAGSYNLQFRKRNDVLFSNQNVTGSSFTLQNLASATDYVVQVESVCGTGSSGFSELISFTTRTSCDFPTGLIASDITATTALISWSLWGSPGVVLKYQIEMRKAGESSFVSSSTSGDSTKKVFTNLLPSTTYEARIKSLCREINSDFSPVITFTTRPARCNTPALPVLSASTNNSATLTWPAIPGALRYRVQYRVLGSGVSGFITQAVLTNSILLTNLSPTMKYEAAVMAECEAVYSPFGQLLLFGTACPAPVNVQVSSLLSGEISISIDPNPLHQSYLIRYGRAPLLGESSGSLINFTRNPFVVTRSRLGVVSKSRYEFKICAVCFNGQRSAFSTTQRIQ